MDEYLSRYRLMPAEAIASLAAEIETLTPDAQAALRVVLLERSGEIAPEHKISEREQSPRDWSWLLAIILNSFLYGVEHYILKSNAIFIGALGTVALYLIQYFILKRLIQWI